jgi:hypothetical protein
VKGDLDRSRLTGLEPDALKATQLDRRARH